MKIEYIKGDLFKTDIVSIMHGCNNQGVMGSGVAAIVRRDYTEAYLKYKEWHQQGTMELGKIQLVESNGKVIINAITQDFYGKSGERFASYDAIDSCMKLTNSVAFRLGWNKVAMPMIGAGLGGGEWSIIERIIEHNFTSVQPVVYQL